MSHDITAYALGILWILILLELTDIVFRVRYREHAYGSWLMLSLYTVAFALLVSHTEWW